MVWREDQSESFTILLVNPVCKIWDLWVGGVRLINGGNLVSPLPTLTARTGDTFNVQAVLRNVGTSAGDVRLRIVPSVGSEQILGPVTNLAVNTNSSTLTSGLFTMPSSDLTLVMKAEADR